jgi:hypothetical protein
MAVAFPALAAGSGTRADARAGKQSFTAVKMRVVFEDQDIIVMVPVGDSATISSHRRGTTLRLVPTVQPAPAGVERQLALQIFEQLEIGDLEQSNLVNVVHLPEQGLVSDIGDLALAVEVVAISEVEQGLRPRTCCITCDGYSACSFCVWTECGGCCAG